LRSFFTLKALGAPEEEPFVTGPEPFTAAVAEDKFVDESPFVAELLPSPEVGVVLLNVGTGGTVGVADKAPDEGPLLTVELDV